jgi:hypothetical protein
MTMLVIRRLDFPLVDQGRQYRVFVDGQQKAQIANDSTVQIGVMPGEHRVELRIDWCRSPEVTFRIEHGAIARMECKPNASLWLALLYITVWRHKYIALNTVDTWSQ